MKTFERIFKSLEVILLSKLHELKLSKLPHDVLKFPPGKSYEQICQGSPNSWGSLEFGLKR